jgi:hypothetical protein
MSPDIDNTLQPITGEQYLLNKGWKQRAMKDGVRWWLPRKNNAGLRPRRLIHLSYEYCLDFQLKHDFDMLIFLLSSKLSQFATGWQKKMEIAEQVMRERQQQERERVEAQQKGYKFVPKVVK